MEVNILYRYTREDGGTTVSPDYAENAEETYRIIAAPGKVLVSRVTGETGYCFDTDNTSEYDEIPEEGNSEYETAGKILLGEEM